ncbi:MAG: metallophosphatase domain-containing protein [Planctomycetota bacterium]|nr:metallophosphatase domain-containing protein [Planctomycetota bacterium]
MRIVAISDTHDCHQHYNTESLPSGDILIHGGDMTRSGTLGEVEAFNTWLGALDFEYKLIIAGNHDWCFQRSPEQARALLTHGIYLEDSGVEIAGLKFWGSPWQPDYNDWAFNRPRGACLAEKWQLIPEQTDVLITHGPPYGIGDQVHSGDHVGCRDLLKRVQRIRPRVHIFGHIHEAYGVTELEGTSFVNASYLSGAGAPIQPAILLTLNAV